ncbi:MAG TPA: cystathionine gamma-lyase [Solirubrobacteraceae bacterium]|nr:cystathionine gamma-lyase [Solirubrobacteraceae bacterium]
MASEHDEVVIKVREGGPYKVTGDFRLTDAHDADIPLPDDGRAVVLCRCGRSRTKPFCDRSHACRTDDTAVVHAGLAEPQQGEPFLAGPVFAAPFHFAGDADAGAEDGVPRAAERFYGRYANPTWAGWEAALGALEGGTAVAFASGMAAVSAVLLPLLAPGDVLVAPSDGYYTVRTLAERQLRPRGIEVRLVPTRTDAVIDALEGASVVWVESPSNPLLDVLDIEQVAAEAHDAGALVAVDNTLATPLRQRPLGLGADFAMASAAKQLTGHSDLILGYVAAAEPARAEALRAWRTTTGSIPGPFEVWLAHRSLATLGVRVERQERTAAALADLLARRGDVAWSRWPGLGCVVSFDLATAERAHAFLDAAKLVAQATSFGGVHSSAERRARWGGDEVSAGLIRMSVGVEDQADLLADVGQALDAARG